MAKIKVEYKTYENRQAKRRVKTINIDLPRDKYGFTLTGELVKNVQAHFETFITCPFSIKYLTIVEV